MKTATLVNSFKEFNIGTTRRKGVLVIISLLFSLGTFAKSPMATEQQVGMFLNSKTCVVLENSDMIFNAYIKDAVQKHWKLTEFEFIDQQEFEKRRFDSKYSFLVLMKSVFDEDPSGVSYNYLNLVLGDPTNDMTNMPEICSIPISYSKDDNMGYEYAIPSIVQFMQKHAKNLEKHRLGISLQRLKYYNGSQDFKNRVLLLSKDVMAKDANTSDKIKNEYPYTFRLLSTAEIQKELVTNPKSTIFLFHVGPGQDMGAGKCFEMIFDVEGNLYYYNYRKVTNDNNDGFNQHDLEQIR